MKLHTYPMSPNSLRVTSVAYHLGIDLQLEFIDVVNGKQLNNPDLERKNPNHRIPTLEDGEFVLWECGAIMIYLAEVQPAPGLLPADFHDRMRVHQWMYWSATSMWPAAWTILFENFGKGPMKLGAGDSATLAKGTADFHRYADVLNRQLRGKDYVMGSPTLADHHLAAAFVHADLAFLPWEPYEEIRRWCDGLFAKPYWQQAFADLEPYPAALGGQRLTRQKL